MGRMGGGSVEEAEEAEGKGGREDGEDGDGDGDGRVCLKRFKKASVKSREDA